MCAERGALKWQCQSDFCPTQITSLIDGLEIGLKGLVFPRHLLPGWHQGRAPLTGISVIIPLGMEVRSRSGAEQSGTAAIKTLHSLVRYSSYISPTLNALVLHEHVKLSNCKVCKHY